MADQPPTLVQLTDLDECNKHIPRYLYRVYAPDSNGHNSTTSFASAAAVNRKGHSKLHEMPPAEVRSALESHRLWQKLPNDEFISWTASLLYALQHAIRKTRNLKCPNICSQECDINICILDTSTIDTSSFFPALNLLQIYRIPSEGRLKHEYHSTEYLFHGKLSTVGCSRTVSLEELRGEGLFDLMPELDDEESKRFLWRRVDELRNTIATTLTPISGMHGGLALSIASLFGGAWTMPVMVALLSLRRRESDDARFLRLLRAFAEPMRDFLVLYAEHAGDALDAPELANFASMMNAGYHEMPKISVERAGGVDGLELAIGHLKLESNISVNKQDDGSADDEAT